MNDHRALRAAMMSIGLAVGAAGPALAGKLTPEATAAERGLAAYSASRLQRAINAGAFHGVAMVGHPVHEEITRRALQCPADGALTPGCAGTSIMRCGKRPVSGTIRDPPQAGHLVACICIGFSPRFKLREAAHRLRTRSIARSSSEDYRDVFEKVRFHEF